MKRADVFHSRPDVMSGTPVFVDTRVPASTIFHYLEAGDDLGTFLYDFPTVSREQSIDMLKLARETLMKKAEEGIFHSKPDTLGGTPVFVGTRVPVRALFDYLKGGHDLYRFLDDFPSVTREQTVNVLKLAREILLDDVTLTES